MADQPQYTGATYNAEMYKLPTETMSEYLARLAKLRSQGILGGGGMLDLKETPTVVTPAAQQPLGELVVRDAGGSDYTPPPDTRTPEEKRAAGIRTLQRKGGWEDIVEGGARLLGAGSVIDLGRSLAASEFEQDLKDRAMSPEYIDEVMSSPKATVDMYSKGGFGDTDPLMDGISYEDAGNSLFYQVPEKLNQFWSGITGQEYTAPLPQAYLYTKPAEGYAQFTNFLAQQTPITRNPTASEMLDGMLMGNGMLSTQADSGDTVYTSSWGDTYDFGSYSPETQAGLSITDTYNDGSFGD